MAKYLISITVLDMNEGEDGPRHVTTRHDYIEARTPNSDMLDITLKVADDVSQDLQDVCPHEEFEHGTCQDCNALEVNVRDWESLAEDRAWEAAK